MNCPKCKKKRKLINDFAMRIDDKLNVIKSEKALCSSCMEEEFWKVYRIAQKEMEEQKLR